jgi:hypothetical protein
MVAELEGKLELQNRQLQEYQTGGLPRTSPFTGQKYSYNYPDQAPPNPPMRASQISYIQTSSEPFPYEAPTPSTETYDVRTGLDHLAQAAMSSTGSRRRVDSAAEIDPDMVTVPLKFPNFPHDIFIPDAETYATKTFDAPSVTSDDWGGTQLVPFGSEADGLPPKELLEIM